MEAIPPESNEKIFYSDSHSNDLVTNTRLRFGSTTLFIHDVIGTDIRIGPRSRLSFFLMKAGWYAAWGLGIYAFFWSHVFALYPGGVFASAEMGVEAAVFPFALFLVKLRD